VGRTGRRLAAVVAGVLLLTGCSHWTELSYRVDKRLTFTEPKDRALVTLPFTVSWTMRDFDVVGPGSTATGPGAGYFAVFIDRSPIGPGDRVEDVASGDRACTTDPSCPDAAYLADKGVYTTQDTSVEITRVKDLGDNGDVQLHLLYVVLMDPSGHRIGETSYRMEFKLRRKATAS
jgi:hypothetical protein